MVQPQPRGRQVVITYAPSGQHQEKHGIGGRVGEKQSKSCHFVLRQLAGVEGVGIRILGPVAVPSSLGDPLLVPPAYLPSDRKR